MTNFARGTRLRVVAASALAVAVSSVAQQYAVTDLGVLTNLTGQSRSTVNAINHHGQVAGVNLADDVYRAFLFSGSGTNLGTLGGTNSAALGINNSVQVVGRSLNTNGLNRAFLWTAGGTNGVAGNPEMKDLGTLGGTESQASAINSSGQICGYSQDSGGGDHAFRYSDGTMVDIHTLGSSLPYSYGFGINAAGHITGSVYNNGFSSAKVFFYNGTNMIDLGSFGWANADGLAINNNDHIVGYVSDASGSGARAFRHVGGVMMELGTLGGHYSYALSINNSNIIVGGSFTDAVDTVYHAFVCVSNSMADLNQLLDATGSGWTLTEARAINDRGQIVGVGILNGENHAFLLNSAPTITRIELNGADVILDFTSFSGGNYFVQGRTNLFDGDWSNLTGNLAGNNGSTTVTNFGSAAGPAGFYRVGLSVP